MFLISSSHDHDHSLSKSFSCHTSFITLFLLLALVCLLPCLFPLNDFLSGLIYNSHCMFCHTLGIVLADEMIHNICIFHVAIFVQHFFCLVLPLSVFWFILRVSFMASNSLFPLRLSSIAVCDLCILTLLPITRLDH